MNKLAESEAQLVARAIPLLAAAFDPYRVSQIATEVAVGRSIADIVLLFGDHVESLPPAALSVSESIALAALRLHGEPEFPIEQLRKSYHLRASDLRRLINWNIITIIGDVVIFPPTRWNEFRIVAIEAKLHRWRQAVDQAAAYQRYADESYVLLPSDLAPPAIRFPEYFHNAGVGLIVVEDDHVEVVFKPRRCTAHRWQREWVLSRLTER